MKKAFTLIELLIVVAIIAILAAIALPNFLDAQIRAKTSRVMADQRTLSVALEQYCLDSNRYPGDWLDTGYQDHKANVKVLTTPVAYIDRILPDPFTIGQHPMVVNHIDTYWYFRFDPVRDAGQPCNAARKGYRWAVESFGPWRELPETNPEGRSARFVLSGYAPFAVYDPTNGSVSQGHIIRTDRGVYTGQDYKPWNPWWPW
ncbi:prepilin-type N-terminal cleavage/methylation domain-containing protein [bacterium]|nr:prepilin-type N-terminal cleavage/methylation domain-containing protein [bacterium]